MNFKNALNVEGVACCAAAVLGVLETWLCLWTTTEVSSADANKTNKTTQTPNDSEISTNKS